MTLKFERALAALLLPTALVAALLFSGCGGGGGGSSSTTTSTTGTSGTPAVYYGSEGDTVVPSLSPGDTIKLGATVTASGSTTPTIIYPYNYSVTAGSSVATVSSTGILTVVGGTVGTSYTVTANSTAGVLTWTFIATGPLAQPVITGVVELSGNVGPVPGVTVSFVNGNGTLLGSGVSAADGSFSVSVPTSTSNFDIDLTNAQTTFTTSTSEDVYSYYSIFSYGSANYNSVSPACLPTVPSLSSGNHHYALPSTIQVIPQTIEGFTIESGNSPVAGPVYSYPPPSPPSCLQ